MTPAQAAGLGYIDDVVEPAETRRKLARFLMRLESKALQNPPRHNGNIPT